MRFRILAGALTVATIFPLFLPLSSMAPARAEGALPPLTAGWLETMNYYRAASGVKAVTSDNTLTKAIATHLNYLIKTDKVLRGGVYASPHTENPASPYYSPEGEAAGKASNIISEGSVDENEAGAIDGWMTAPFHAVGILRETLKNSALAMATAENDRTYWGLNVIAGLSPSATRTKNILFPGDGSTVRLSRFESESPDPREGCAGDIRSYIGLPIFASLLKDPTKDVTAEVIDANGKSLSGDELCVQTQYTFKSTDSVMGPSGAKAFSGDNLVIIIPRDPLLRGNYKVRIKQGGVADIAWSFTVLPVPAEGVVQGIPSQKVPVRRLLKWSLGTAVADSVLTSQRVRIWSCPENKCTTNQVVLDRALPVTQTSLDVSLLKDGFYFTCIEPINASGPGKCSYQIIHVVNSCDTTTCFVGSTWNGPESRCWQVASTGLLEELRGKSWVKVASSPAIKGKCSTAKFPYSYSAKYEVSTTGKKTFRWRILPTAKVLGLALPGSAVQFLPVSGG